MRHVRGGVREGKFCLTLSPHHFDDSPQDVEPLLSTWGGEGIYSRRGIPLQPRLQRLGRPTVVAAVPVHPDSSWQLALPSLDRLFVAALRGLRLKGELHHLQPVAPHDILSFWQPGEADLGRAQRRNTGTGSRGGRGIA